jgi:hypothetical protein
VTPSVKDWFDQVWTPRTEDQKVKVLNDLVAYPERIFFILLKEAFEKGTRGERISDRLVNEGFKLMAQVVKEPEKDVEEPEKPEHIPEEMVGQGTGLGPPGDVPAENVIKDVQPAIKEEPSDLAPTTLRKTTTPEERREERKKKLEEDQKRLRERGITERAQRALKRFQDETVEPRKQKQRGLGKRPFFDV